MVKKHHEDQILKEGLHFTLTLGRSTLPVVENIE